MEILYSGIFYSMLVFHVLFRRIYFLYSKSLSHILVCPLNFQLNLCNRGPMFSFPHFSYTNSVFPYIF